MKDEGGWRGGENVLELEEVSRPGAGVRVSRLPDGAVVVFNIVFLRVPRLFHGLIAVRV